MTQVRAWALCRPSGKLRQPAAAGDEPACLWSVALRSLLLAARRDRQCSGTLCPVKTCGYTLRCSRSRCTDTLYSEVYSAYGIPLRSAECLVSCVNPFNERSILKPRRRLRENVRGSVQRPARRLVGASYINVIHSTFCPVL